MITASSSLGGNIFSQWQPEYAARNIATFPVKIVGSDKVPMVRGYGHVGLRGSAALAKRFDAGAMGMLLGRNRYQVVDVDSKSESALSDALSIHGDTPVIARTASKGGYHCYYGFNSHSWRHYLNKRRAIRPDPSKPIDYLGGGFAVVPPSRTPNGRYEFIQGGIEDLERLPQFRGVVPPMWEKEPRGKEPASETKPLTDMRVGDGRNDAIFLAIGPTARSIHQASGSQSELLQAAQRYNAQCAEPMEGFEVNRIVQSVWRMTLEGRNIIGTPIAFCLTQEHLTLDADAFKLLAFYRAHQGPHALFICTNELGNRAEFNWKPKRVARARQQLVELGHFVLAEAARRGHAARYRWGIY
jgi:hypothetical protein